MNWSKPHFEERRFGFEVTMYIYQKANPSTRSEAIYAEEPQQATSQPRRTSIAKSLGLLGLALSASISTSAVAQSATATVSTTSNIADGNCDDGGINGASWPLNGLNRFNSSNASSISQINTSNVNKLKLKWIYSLPIIPLGTALNPNDDPRAENGASNGVAVDANGIVYVPTFDGHMYIINSLQTHGTDPITGFTAPVVQSSLDFFADPKFSTKFNPFASRLHPSLINGAIYAGNYKFFGGVNTSGANAPTSTGTTSPTCLGPASVGQPGQFCPKYPAMNGAVLYKIDAKTGKLVWQTQIDNNQQTMVSASGAVTVPWILGQNLIVVGFSSEISGTVATFPFSPDPFRGTAINERGGIAAVLESTGQLIWKTYTEPKLTNAQASLTLDQIIAHGSVNAWFGGGLWGGGSFPVSYRNQMVYAGTGEVYDAPDAADQCEQQLLINNPNGPTTDTQCLQYLQNGQHTNISTAASQIENLLPIVSSPLLPSTDSVIAYNYFTGLIQWSHYLGGYDVWNAACLQGIAPGFINLSPMCPPYLRGAFSGSQFTTKDRDVGPPILVENANVGGKVQDIVLGMSKGAIVVAFNAATGQQLWVSNFFGPGGLNGDGFIWGKATDGNLFYGNTGDSSGLTLADYQAAQTCNAHHNCNAINNPSRIIPGSCDLVNAPNNGFGSGAGNPTDVWNGGMYVAINLYDGSVAWQRCVIAKVVNPTTHLLTGQTLPGRSQAPTSYANGVVVAPGASNYIPFQFSPLNANSYAEVLLLNAANGAILTSLPLSPTYSSPSASDLTYQRPAIVGDRLYIATGAHTITNPTKSANPYDRVLMFQLSH